MGKLAESHCGVNSAGLVRRLSMLRSGDEMGVEAVQLKRDVRHNTLGAGIYQNPTSPPRTADRNAGR